MFSRYDALVANENREKIREEIKRRTEEIFKEEGLQGKVRVNQVFIKNLQIAKELSQSALYVIASQNTLKAKEYEVQTAKKEAERMNLLSQNKSNIDYMDAQARLNISHAMLNGKVSTVVVPYDFKGFVSIK